MAYNNVDTEALREVVAALTEYTTDMNGYIAQMRDAAQDCSDNMGSDRYCAKAIENLDDCIDNLKGAMEYAEEIRRAIIELIIRIEEEDE